jgi:hypothetical protein
MPMGGFARSISARSDENDVGSEAYHVHYLSTTQYYSVGSRNFSSSPVDSGVRVKVHESAP